MILWNGVVRTLDPSLPTCGALAIAGAQSSAASARTSLRCRRRSASISADAACCRRSRIRTSTSRPGRSRGGTCTWRRPTRSRAALALVAAHPRGRGTWIRGTGWRDAAWPEAPTAAALDTVTGDTPAALWSKDYHSLWLNSAGARTGRQATWRCPAASSSATAGGRADRDPARGVGLALPRALRHRDRGRVRRCRPRDGIRVANSRGVAAVHDKDGWLGAASIFGRIHENEGLTLRVWQSLPDRAASGARRTPAPVADRATTTSGSAT